MGGDPKQIKASTSTLVSIALSLGADEAHQMLNAMLDRDGDATCPACIAHALVDELATSGGPR